MATDILHPHASARSLARMPVLPALLLAGTLTACSLVTPLESLESGADVAECDDQSCPATPQCNVGFCGADGCSLRPEEAGVAALQQTPNDCNRAVCDGHGGVMLIPDDDPPLDDGNPCTDELCEAGSPQHRPKSEGAACAQGVCDASAACVPCVAASDCLSGVCQLARCVPASCDDGVSNGDETDMDCGGSCGSCPGGLACLGSEDCQTHVCADGACSTCDGDGDCPEAEWCFNGACLADAPLGTNCVDYASCASGICVYGVCCDSLCEGTCRSCFGTYTGLLNGTCGYIVEGTDPYQECAGAMTCDGAGACL